MLKIYKINISPILHTWVITFSWQNTKNVSTEEWSPILKWFGNYYFAFEYLSWNITLIIFSFSKGQTMEDTEVRHLYFYKHHLYIICSISCMLYFGKNILSKWTRLNFSNSPIISKNIQLNFIFITKIHIHFACYSIIYLCLF